MVNLKNLIFLFFFLPLYPRQNVLRVALGILNKERPLILMSIENNFAFCKLDPGTRLLYWLCCVDTSGFSQIKYNPNISQNILEPPFDTVFTSKTTMTNLCHNKQGNVLIIDQYFVFAGLCMASAFILMANSTNTQVAAREILRTYCSQESIKKIEELYGQLLGSQLLNHICQQSKMFRPQTTRFLDMLGILTVKRILRSQLMLQERLAVLLRPFAGDNDLLEAKVKSISRFFEALAKAINVFIENCSRATFSVDRATGNLNMALSPACREVLYDLAPCKRLSFSWIRMALSFIND